MMESMETRKFREALLDRAAAAFARDKLDEAGLEALIARIQDAPGELELREAEAYLAFLVPPEAPQNDLEESRDFVLNMSNLKRRGDWVDARTYRLEGKMSNFELDYLSYAEERGFSMLLEVDLSMSNLKLVVPPDWQVDCRIARNVAGNVVDRGPSPARSSNRIVVEGSLSMSNIKVKRRLPGRRGFLAILFGR